MSSETPTENAKKPGRLLLKDEGALESMHRWYDEVKREWLPSIHALGFQPGTDQEKTALLILLGFVTQDSRHLTRVTGWDVYWIQDRRLRARKAGIWRGNGTLHAAWLDLIEQGDGSADVAFLCDVFTVNGEFEKDRMGRYRLSEEGLKLARDMAPLDEPSTGPEVARMVDDGCPHV